MGVVGTVEGGEVTAGGGEGVVAEGGLDLGGLGTGVLHRPHEGVPQHRDLAPVWCVGRHPFLSQCVPI